MFEKYNRNICCLCFTPKVGKFKYLQNDMGESNEIYEVIVKYFDPMLLTERFINGCTKESAIICQNCWTHIQDFHDFEESILKTRTVLEQVNAQKLPPHNSENEDGVFNNGNYICNKEISTNDTEKDNNVAKNVNKISKVCNDVGEKEQHQYYTKFLNGDSSEQLKSLSSENNTGYDENFRGKLNSEFNPILEKGKEYDTFISEWKSQLECDICCEAFPLFETLKIHFKEKHDTKAYVKCCDRKFDRRCRLVDHIRLHINPEMHKCDICGKLSRSKYNLKLHKKFIHEETPQFECNECSKTFKQKQNLETHMLTHATGNKDFKCNECGKTYVLEFQLKKHIKLVHIDNRICDQCGKTLNSIGALKNHLKEHSRMEKPKYPCDECGTILGSNSSLKSHKAAYHNDGSTVYICSICGKVSATERGLKNHRKYVHEIERKHKCPHCDKAFKRPKNLQEHIATHTGEALYQCLLCSRSFKMHTKYHEHLKKAHPIEWEEGRKNKLEKQKIDYERVTSEVII